MSLGDNLRVIRTKKNISVQEVSNFLNVERKTYNKWETTGKIKSEYIPKLADFFQVEIGDLFKEKSSDIIINQYNADNQGNPISGIIILLSDKESVNQLVEVVRERFEKK